MKPDTHDLYDDAVELDDEADTDMPEEDGIETMMHCRSTMQRIEEYIEQRKLERLLSDDPFAC